MVKNFANYTGKIMVSSPVTCMHSFEQWISLYGSAPASNIAMHSHLMVVCYFLCCLTSDVRGLADLLAAILQRVGDDIDPNYLPQILVYLKIIICHVHLVQFLISPYLEILS